MDFAAAWEKTAFIITHVTVLELPLVLAGTAAAAYALARVLDKHNARAREAKLARRVAAVYAVVLAGLFLAREFMK